MKRTLIAFLMAMVPLVSCAEPRMEPSPGHYVLQLPGLKPESGADHKAGIKAYDVVLTNSTTGQLVLVQSSPGPNWFHIVTSPSNTVSTDISKLSKTSEKLPGLIVFLDKKVVRCRGLWVQGEAVLMVELQVSRMATGRGFSALPSSYVMWRGTAEVQFEARMSPKDRLRYTMECSMAPRGGAVGWIPGDVTYNGPKVRRRSVAVETGKDPNLNNMVDDLSGTQTITVVFRVGEAEPKEYVLAKHTKLPDLIKTAGGPYIGPLIIVKRGPTNSVKSIPVPVPGKQFDQFSLEHGDQVGVGLYVD